MRVLDADAATIEVAPHGVDSSTFHLPDDSETVRLQARLGLLGQPYVPFRWACSSRARRSQP